MRRLSLCLLLGFIACCSGCITLDRYEEKRIREIDRLGASYESVKSPAGAAVLNVLPGFGNFYLAAGTRQSEQWGVGIVNLLLWPWSVVWGIPQAGHDADIMNKKETVYYYTKTNDGKERLAQLRDGGSTIPVKSTKRAADATTD